MNRPVRVLHLISAFQMGGAEKLLLDLAAENARDREIDFTIVVMNDLLNEELVDELRRTGSEVHLLRRPPTHRHPRYLWSLLRLIRRRRIQIIHAHNYGSKMWAILCKLAFPRLKVVFTIHDTNIVSRLGAFSRWLHRWAIDRNIAISNSVLAECREARFDNAVRIYNGIRTAKFSEHRRTPASADAKAGLRLVNVARLTHRKKGQDVLIRAVKRCADQGLNVTCDLIGGAYEYDKGSPLYLNELVRELGLEGRVRFLGNRYDVERLLPQYDAFVLPSRFEGLGLVLLEAMAAGLPVVASNIDGPAELIENGKNGLLFPNEDDAALAEMICDLARNERLIDDLSENAALFVKDFDMDVMLGKYKDMYEQLTVGGMR
ncbi:glycosyltransferase family 4 protein [Cohnella sp. AR92]|uniref:glycosyltransferase family 4 protein n=1 Tax=Cohnella sp. AR92 TaxID=648716 RepID=UPI000F8C6D57|nr:glycosyltransferase family 4 protein [Cohnella sp. AR92]RUS42611.1 glycosyltransferase family 1 protein [Cohnella sp. AR92]